MPLFSTFAFPATGAPTPRTMPDRLAEIHNVMDFDAKGDGSTIDTAAIQAAADAASSAGGGTVYFPLGTYKTDAPITYNTASLSIRFRGEGNGTNVTGNFNGFIFDRHLGSPSNTASVVFEKMNINNSNTGTSSGAIRLGSTTQAAIRDIGVSGFVCITTEDAAGVSSQNIFLENVKFQGLAVTNSKGLVIGGSGEVAGCDFIGSDIGAVIYGSGLHMAGNRCERCNTGYQFGCDSAGTDQGASGFSCNGSMEGNTTSIYFKGTCTGGFLGPLGFLGHPASNSGMTNGVANTQYGLRIDADKAKACVFYNLTPNDWHDVAGISIAAATSRANNVFFASNSSVGFGAGVPYIMPTNAYTARFIQCDVQPIWTVSQLPTGGNAFEGDEFNVRDSNTATWGATAAGSGSNHVGLRYNGTNWTVVGK